MLRAASYEILITQREYVEGCLEWYRETDLEQGNPEDGEWHECHYPVPQCLKGSETILLLKEHHAVQGVLQSEEYQHPCVYGWEKQYLIEHNLELWKKWMALKGQSGLTAMHDIGWTEASKQKLSLTMSGENNPMYGKTRSDEFKENVSTKMKGRKLDANHRNKISKGQTGNKNHMFGRIGDANPMFGKKWWVNQNGQTKLSHCSPGPEWQRGRKLP